MAEISGSFTGNVRVQTAVALDDAPNHALNLAQIEGTQRSPQPQWNGNLLRYWGTADLIGGSGSQRGYFVNQHDGGDRDWGTFEGRVTASGTEVTLEGTWMFTGGSGQFQGIGGGGQYRGHMPSADKVEMEWHGQYELAIAKAAGT